jgi:hypothetical protein
VDNSKYITVLFLKNRLVIRKEVAAEFNLTPNQTLKTEAEFWKVLNANATFNIERIKLVLQSNHSLN